MDLEAFPMDLVLPEVKIASDGAQMREIFKKYLRPSGTRTYHIQDCVLTRIRHRKAARCILQYNLRLTDSETGAERIQWATGVIYPSDRAQHLWKKLGKADPKPEISGAFQTFEPVSFIPELKMLVQLFPYDHRLPALKQMMTGPSPEIEALFLAQFGPGSWYTESWNVEPIRYRAGLAVVLQYTIQARDKSTGRRSEKRFYAKIYRDERGEEIYRILQALWQKGNVIGEHFTVGKPIAYLSESRVLFQEEASGISLQQILIDSQDEEAVSAARKVARALASLHLDNIPTARRHLVQDEIAILAMRGKTLQWACPDLKEEIEAVISTVVASLQEVPLKPAHLDLKTDHILLEGYRYALLDFDSFALGDPVLDAAHVLAQIFGMQFRFPVTPYRLRMAADAFADEYFAHVPGEWRSRLRSYYAAAALKVAVGFFRRQEPHWVDKVAVLIEEAQTSLAGRGLRGFSAPSL
jgi:phosphotransferase family enzyme